MAFTACDCDSLLLNPAAIFRPPAVLQVPEVASDAVGRPKRFLCTSCGARWEWTQAKGWVQGWTEAEPLETRTS